MNKTEQSKQRTVERITDVEALMEQGVRISDAIEQVGWSIETAYKTLHRHNRIDLRDKLYAARNPDRVDSPKLQVDGHAQRRAKTDGVFVPECLCGEQGIKPMGRERRMRWQQAHVRSMLADLSSDKAGIICTAAGITYRQLDHWTRSGYLKAEASGKGKPRDWEEDAVFIAVDMARLVAAGLDVAQAARVARRHVQHPDRLGRYVLAPGIMITVTS